MKRYQPLALAIFSAITLTACVGSSAHHEFVPSGNPPAKEQQPQQPPEKPENPSQSAPPSSTPTPKPAPPAVPTPKPAPPAAPAPHSPPKKDSNFEPVALEEVKNRASLKEITNNYPSGSNLGLWGELLQTRRLINKDDVSNFKKTDGTTVGKVGAFSIGEGVAGNRKEKLEAEYAYHKNGDFENENVSRVLKESLYVKDDKTSIYKPVEYDEASKKFIHPETKSPLTADELYVKAPIYEKLPSVSSSSFVEKVDAKGHERSVGSYIYTIKILGKTNTLTETEAKFPSFYDLNVLDKRGLKEGDIALEIYSQAAQYSLDGNVKDVVGWNSDVKIGEYKAYRAPYSVAVLTSDFENKKLVALFGDDSITKSNKPKHDNDFGFGTRLQDGITIAGDKTISVKNKKTDLPKNLNAIYNGEVIGRNVTAKMQLDVNFGNSNDVKIKGKIDQIKLVNSTAQDFSGYEKSDLENSATVLNILEKNFASNALGEVFFDSQYFTWGDNAPNALKTKGTFYTELKGDFFGPQATEITGSLQGKDDAIFNVEMTQKKTPAKP